MSPFVLRLNEIERSTVKVVGGKAANLGELLRIDRIRVPDGFCVTTEAYKQITGNNQELNGLLDELARLQTEERGKINEISAKLRKTIEGLPIPEDIAAAIAGHLANAGERDAFAVRSSATAEDLPTASFAGQQDTYLNIIGKEAILRHISKCWASLFTERAVIYRLQNGFDHRTIRLAVIVQQMVFPQAAGIMFTADPVTSNRKVLSIDASFGLGEALVSGLVNADSYKVSDGKLIDKKVSAKKLAIYAAKDGGTMEREIEPERQNRQALTNEQILQLCRLGKKIEAHFGFPQDIEWCLVEDSFFIVQSRPITTLYPIPEAKDQENRVYVSVGHQQMMTDAMKPLGLSFYLLVTSAPMHKAGGRLFVDISRQMASSAGRKMMIEVLGKSDPLIRDVLMAIVKREDFIQLSTVDENQPDSARGRTAADYQTLKEYDAAVVADLIKRSQTSIAELKQNIQRRSGPELFDFILQDIGELKKIMSDPQSFGVIMTGMNASSWINEKMEEWLGEKNVADTLSQSAPNNITSEMGLALLDVADVIRSYPEIIDYLQQLKDDHFLDELDKFDGGQEVRDAILVFLDKYGMRCAGEIDITRTRWSEKPATLVPTILGNIRNFEPGAGKRRFQRGLQEALKKEEEVLYRLEQLPDSDQKVKESKRMIDLVRHFIGYREYPKYGIVSRFLVYKRALLKEAEKLVAVGVIREKEDIYYLAFEELRDAVRTKALDHSIIGKRKDEYGLFEKLTPPRIITSDGEIIAGKYNREDLPAGAIAGLAVSSGVVEGRARVILRMEDAELEEGDILVTTFTDPSWTPLFVSIKGLVTEVGGLMTHGAVIAREYGLPAVVGVQNATKLIRDGQQIRVHGTDGWVVLL
jgi:rifampicin phosphotransferase